MPGQTGPKSRNGKANSSRNSTKHGMRSHSVLVGDERQEDFDRLAAGWRAEYEPEGQAAESLIQRVILTDWFLRRAETAYMDAESELSQLHPLDRSADQHARILLYLRYKTTAERSFYRAYNALRGLRKDKIKEELDWMKVRNKLDKYAVEAVEKAVGDRKEKPPTPSGMAKHPLAPTPASAPSRSQALFHAQHHPKKQRKLSILDQWIEVEIHDGKAVTKLYPSNAALIKQGQSMDPPPDLVYRRLNFPNGIPAEYHWAAASHPERFERGGHGIQRMTVETWLDVIDREEAGATGHIGPTGVGNLPRPKERGECDCDVCTHNRDLLERQAAAD